MPHGSCPYWESCTYWKCTMSTESVLNHWKPCLSTVCHAFGTSPWCSAISHWFLLCILPLVLCSPPIATLLCSVTELFPGRSISNMLILPWLLLANTSMMTSFPFYQLPLHQPVVFQELFLAAIWTVSTMLSTINAPNSQCICLWWRLYRHKYISGFNFPSG